MLLRTSRHNSISTRQKGSKTPFFSNTNAQSIQAKEEHPFFQPKLTINQPGDKYEQEADAMAEQVVQSESIQRQSNPEEEEMLQDMPLSKAAIQRQCAECEEAGQLQRQAAPEEEEMLQSKPLMRVAENGAATATPQLASQLNSSKGSGQPLPKDTLSSMNNVFGTDFSGVHVHTGSRAQAMSQGIQAITHGSDIYFNRGQYNPGSTEGKRLLGHELTHVVQQNRNDIKNRPLINKSGFYRAKGNYIARFPINTGKLACKVASLAQAASLNTRYPGWLSVLPNCPCSENQVINNPSTWKKDSNPFLFYHHPGASSSYRTKSSYSSVSGTNHGQQCTYDSNGKLITRGAGAGTPDVVSPEASRPRHFVQDVVPWECLGSSIYNMFWVPNNGNGCKRNP